MDAMDIQSAVGKDFIRQIVTADVAALKNGGRVQTRFPPEPNGYLHIGHAKAICLSFDIAAEFSGKCYLRFDDTNPEKEDSEFIEAIRKDISWLGYDWDALTHASDYFQQIYEFAVQLVKQGKAYVDDSSAEQIRAHRGTLTRPGTESPNRMRSIEDNLMLFEAMREGQFDEGHCVLRAKIDMASPNINLRDPTLYRIRKVPHQKTGEQWCIYPMYDFAHTLSDVLEGTTHSLCSLEFEDHRPLYEWFVAQCSVTNQPQQIEFSRLNLMFTIMSKRRLKKLVDEGHTEGWDDPRMPTLSGMRRRGYPSSAIRDFSRRVGITKKENVIQLGSLEFCVREKLNENSQRRFAVLDPLKLIIENYAEGEEELLDAANHPNRPELGSRKIPFSREIYIEKNDFMEDPPGKFYRLKPGGEVRLRYAYIIRCEEIIRDSSGNIVALRCTYDPDTRSGDGINQRKVKGTIHWVSAKHAERLEVRLYDRLFLSPNPGQGDVPFADSLNSRSMEVVKEAALEQGLSEANIGDTFQFERLGYFCVDTIHSEQGQPVFNRTVTLRDSWAKIEKQALASISNR